MNKINFKLFIVWWKKRLEIFQTNILRELSKT